MKKLLAVAFVLVFALSQLKALEVHRGTRHSKDGTGLARKIVYMCLRKKYPTFVGYF